MKATMFGSGDARISAVEIAAAIRRAMRLLLIRNAAFTARGSRATPG